MKQKRRLPRTISLSSLIPNAITTVCLCIGFSSVYLGLKGSFEWAWGCILVATVLDGLDGKVARLLNGASPLGAQLDSLADLVNFGVCPGLLAYLVALKEWSNFGWSVVLLLLVSLCYRLARFNVASDEEKPLWSHYFSIGLPAPASACMALLPLSLYFATGISFFIDPLCFLVSVACSSFLMISRFPTFLVNKIPIKSKHVPSLLFISLVLIMSLASYFWTTLSFLCLVHIVSLYFSYKKHKNFSKTYNVSATHVTPQDEPLNTEHHL